MQEIFKPIKNYEGLYSISNFGNIRSERKKGSIKIFLLSKAKTQKGYFRISLCKNGISKKYYVAHLVWDNFGNGKRNGMILQVDHKDGNKQNNRIDNLQLLNNRDNLSKGFIQNGKKTSQYTGVTKIGKKWRAQIGINKEQIRLGLYSNEFEALVAYQRALKEYDRTGKLIFNRPGKRIYSSKYKGIHKLSNKWCARITINGKREYLGWFETEEKAYIVYKKKEKEA